jgi:NAD(P)-dependent dehydrogenase (short-subunit alcohol dehydrogenase family)
MVQGIKNSPRYEETLKLTPVGRWGMPKDIAAAAVYLCSSASDFVTGTTLFVDGGTTVTYGASLPSHELPEF